MKVKLFFHVTFLSILTTCITSCSSDDNIPSDPIGTVALNMMNEDNGQTTLGHSDVYINNANNFYSSSCFLSSLGKKNGLGSISEEEMLLQGGANQAAVEPGNAYQIFSKNAIKQFPSGKLALSVASNYYNVYVVSQMKRDDEIIGANVKFILMDAPDYGLPESKKYIGVLDHKDGNKFEIIIDLPTSDFEYETTFGNVLGKVEHKKEGNKIVVRLVQYEGYSYDIGFYIHIKDSYTYVYGSVE